MKKLDLGIIIPSILISSLGLITLLSTEISENLLSLDNIFIKQFIFTILGIVIFFIITRFDISLLKFRGIVLFIYISTVLLLILTLIFGQEVNGAKRWLSMFSIQLQPSELAKLSVILVTAYIFSLGEKYNELILTIVSFLLTLPILFLVYLEPHGSMTLIILLLWFVSVFLSLSNSFRNILIILVGGLNFVGLFVFTVFHINLFLVLPLIGVIVTIFSLFSKLEGKWIIGIICIITMILGLGGSFIFNNVLGDYQRQRITAFQNPEENNKDASFNVEQSKIAIGSGGIFGKGFANGSQTRLKILPFHQTDFIFAAYAEEFGLIGSLILISLYIYLILKSFMFSIAKHKYTFENTLVIGISVKIFIEVFINLGTNLGIIPATGIPLPLMSAGGTITIVTFFSLGLIQCIISSINQNEMYKISS